MDECGAIWRQYSRHLLKVNPEGLSVGMHQRIEAEHEIDGRILCDRNRSTVIPYDHNMRILGEATSAGVYACRREIYRNQPLTVLFQELRPPSKTRSNFNDGTGGEERLDARKDNVFPDIVAPSPRFRPFISALGPIVSGFPHAFVLVYCRHKVPKSRLGNRCICKYPSNDIDVQHLHSRRRVTTNDSERRYSYLFHPIARPRNRRLVPKVNLRRSSRRNNARLEYVKEPSVGNR